MAASRPIMHDWSDVCDYMDALESENERLRAALQNAIAHARTWKDITDTTQAKEVAA